LQTAVFVAERSY